MTKTKEPDPRAFIPFDDEEKDLMELVEKSNLKSVPNAKVKINELKEAAKSTFAKKRQINIRLSEFDLKDIQIKAIEEGIPYQTLISSILHKYVTGRIS